MAWGVFILVRLHKMSYLCKVCLHKQTARKYFKIASGFCSGRFARERVKRRFLFADMSAGCITIVSSGPNLDLIFKHKHTHTHKHTHRFKYVASKPRVPRVNPLITSPSSSYASPSTVRSCIPLQLLIVPVHKTVGQTLNNQRFGLVELRERGWIGIQMQVKMLKKLVCVQYIRA